MSEHEAAPGAVAGQDQRNLLMRVAAALVMAPVAIGAAYAGGWWWITLVTLATIGLYIEWMAVVGAARNKGAVIAGVGALTLSGWGLAFDRIEASLLMLAIGLVNVGALSGQLRRWTIAGFLYAAIAQLASIVVRLDQTQGLAALILVLLVVWATDIGGYFAGRAIGGPKLWPRVSPKKTWAGALGGFAASLVVAAGFAAFGFNIWLMLLLAAVLSIASQFGDLFESAVKRHFGVKDSSHIIPGHGGLMDRLDGFVAAIALAAIFGFLPHGVDGVGRALMVW